MVLFWEVDHKPLLFFKVRRTCVLRLSACVSKWLKLHLSYIECMATDQSMEHFLCLSIPVSLLGSAPQPSGYPFPPIHETENGRDAQLLSQLDLAIMSVFL